MTLSEQWDKLLVLDLDETLIHTTQKRSLTTRHREPHFEIPDGYVVYERPGVREFLASCLERFQNVGIWTAGTRAYAYEVLPNLCNTEDFSFIWGRDRCSVYQDMETREQFWIKDIHKLRRLGYAKESLLFVEDTARNLIRSYGNLIHVRAWYEDPEDDELPRLLRYLETISSVPNVRTIDKRFWRNTP